MSQSDPSEAERAFLARLGGSVCHWNYAEAQARHFLSFLIGGTAENDVLKARALTAGYPLPAVLQALRNMAANFVEPPMDEEVKFAADYLDTLSHYRNFYVHGISFTVDVRGEAFAPVHVFSARGKLQETRDKVVEQDLAEFEVYCLSYVNFVSNLYAFLSPKIGAAFPPTRPARPPALQKTATAIIAKA